MIGCVKSGVNSAQPAIRPAETVRAWLMQQALPALLALLTVATLLLLSQAAQAQGTETPPGIRSGVAQSTGIKVTMPNGFATVQQTDLSLASVGGQVTWTRCRDGLEWKFNPNWGSLSGSWSKLMGGGWPIALSSQASSNPDRKAV